MNGEGRTRRGGHVPANDFGHGRDDKEVRVACLGSDSKDSFVTASKGLEEQDHSVLDYTARSEGQTELDWIGSWGTYVEAGAEEIMCMETNMYENVGSAACIETPKRQTHTAGEVGPSNVLRFGSDQQRIASRGMFVKAAEEEVLSMEENGFGNVRLVACTGPPKRLAQIASHARQSFF